MINKIRDLFAAASLAVGNSVQEGGMQDPEQQQMGPKMPSEVSAAQYIRLLTKLGYEYQGSDEDLGGGAIGSSFTGPDGDSIMIKPDGSWTRFGPGSQRTQGKSTQDLGNALVRDSLQQGDDANHHTALRQSGYQKIHKDGDGNTYYKHPKTGKTVHVRKDGSWGSSAGTGRGASKLRDFLGNEAVDMEDPAMMQMNLKKQRMRQQMNGPGRQVGGRATNGTRASSGTRVSRY